MYELERRGLKEMYMSHDVLSSNRQSGFLGKMETAVPCRQLLLLSLCYEKTSVHTQPKGQAMFNTGLLTKTPLNLVSHSGTSCCLLNLDWNSAPQTLVAIRSIWWPCHSNTTATVPAWIS